LEVSSRVQPALPPINCLSTWGTMWTRIHSDTVPDLTSHAMFAKRRNTLLVTKTIILMLLFAQSLYAAQACTMPVHEPAKAVGNSPDCHQETVTTNACLQQCTAGNQSSAQVEIAVAQMPAVAVLSVPLAADPGACPAVTLVSLAHSPDPPSSIRFCSFQL
jgi:hypothetical protein